MVAGNTLAKLSSKHASHISMKVTLTKDQALADFADLEEVHCPETHGYMKRPEDPPIKTLLTWNPEDSPKKKGGVKSSGKWTSEMRDSYRGFFFNEDNRKVFRLKEEDTPSFDPSSLAENSKEKTLTSLKVTAREIPKEESGLIDSSFNDQQPTKAAAPAPAPAVVPEQAHATAQPATKPTKRQVTGARAKSAVPKEDVEEEERRKRQEARIKKLHQTTRWLPNSAFTTYFGKPPFCAYGQGNTKPTVGGVMYGNYLATHNVGAQEGANNPMYQQVYETAELYASKRPTKKPEPPRKCKDEDRLTPDQVEELKRRSQITGKERKNPSKPIIKPDLLKAKTFQSVHSTPNLSRVEEHPGAATQPVAFTQQVPTLRPEEKQATRPVPEPKREADTRPRPEQVVRLPADPHVETPIPVKADLADDHISPPTEEPHRLMMRDEGVQLDPRTETGSPRTIRMQPTPSLIPLSPAPRLGDEGQVSAPRGDDCDQCMQENLLKLQYATSYRDMTGKAGYQPEIPLAQPFRYCERCQAK